MTRQRSNRYAMISHADLVSRALEMKAEINYRKKSIKRELEQLETAEKMYRNMGATRLATACGADRAVTDAIAIQSDPDVAERAARAVADRRWREAESPSAHAATSGQVAGRGTAE